MSLSPGREWCPREVKGFPAGDSIFQPLIWWPSAWVLENFPNTGSGDVNIFASEVGVLGANVLKHFKRVAARKAKLLITEYHDHPFQNAAFVLCRWMARIGFNTLDRKNAWESVVIVFSAPVV